MQNAAFAARGLDWAYVALAVPAPRLERAVAGLAALGFAGANVTIPHKEAVVGFCDELEGFAERAGSVNTLVIQDGRVSGSSTDGLAVAEAVDVVGASALLLGAGGAARAVAAALVEAGVARLTVAARSSEQAQTLVARLRAVFPVADVAARDEWPPTSDGAALIVNATPVHHEPLVALRGDEEIVDLAYRAGGEATAFVDAARAAGCERIVDGLDVLVRQGAAAFERWTGIPAPVDVMRAALRFPT